LEVKQHKGWNNEIFTNPDVYSDPTKLLNIPFPGSFIPERFLLRDGKFAFMGREEYGRIRETIAEHHHQRSERNFDKLSTYYLFGNLGWGKSHLLLTMAVDLFATYFSQNEQSRKRVVVIPDCAELMKNPFKVLRNAYWLAFADDGDISKLIYDCTDPEDFSFVGEYCEDNNIQVLFIVDQYNALDIPPENDKSCVSEKKLETAYLLYNLTCGHLTLLSASANNESAKVCVCITIVVVCNLTSPFCKTRGAKQQNFIFLDLFGGFSLVRNYNSPNFTQNYTTLTIVTDRTSTLLGRSTAMCSWRSIKMKN